MFENHTIKYKLDFLLLNLENLGQLSQDFQKVLIFEYCKNYSTGGNVSFIQYGKNVLLKDFVLVGTGLIIEVNENLNR